MNKSYEPHSHTGRSSRQTHKTNKHSDWLEVLLFYLLPFVAVNGILLILVAAKPHITIQASDTKDYKTTSISVTVKSLLPIKTFTSTQEGAPLELTGGKKGTYTAEITQNGVIEIHAAAINGMTDTKYEHINILDDVAPVVNDQYSIQDNILTLTLEDSQSGLDSQSVHASTLSGVSLSPVFMDKQSSTFSFDMTEDTLIIHASDLAGNEMQATFSTNADSVNPEEIPADEIPVDEIPADDTAEAESEVTDDSAQTADSEAASPESAPADTSVQASEPSGHDSEVTIHIDTKTP